MGKKKERREGRGRQVRGGEDKAKVRVRGKGNEGKQETAGALFTGPPSHTTPHTTPHHLTH